MNWGAKKTVARNNKCALITIKKMDVPFSDLPGKDNIALCRCGKSAKKPFCDGSHRTVGFCAAETAPPPPTEIGAPPSAT